MIDLTAAEVIGNINAMNAAVHELGPGDPITPDTLLGFHRRLMANSRLSAQPAGSVSSRTGSGAASTTPLCGICAAAA